MSIQNFTLNQICKERPCSPPLLEISTQRSVSADDIIFAYTATVKLCDVLRHLVTALTLPRSLDEMLHTVAVLTTQTMGIDLCIVLLKDQVSDSLRLCTSAPDLYDTDVLVRPIGIEPDLWERLHRSIAQGRVPQLHSSELDQLNPLRNVQYKTLVSIPLIAGTEYIGLMNCYSSKCLLYCDEDQLLLCAIANQMALAIKHRQSIDDVLEQKTLIKTFVSDLISGISGNEEIVSRQACFLGFDLTRPHAVALIELSHDDVSASPLQEKSQGSLVSREEHVRQYDSIVQQLQQSIQKLYPGSLVAEHDNLLVGFMCQSDEPDIDRLTSWLDQLIRRVQQEQGMHLSAGLGNLCHAMNDYQRGYAEANEALELGKHLLPEGGCVDFNALGAYRYLYRFAHTDTLRDQYQDQVAAIAEYDRRKKANLLDTLEVYLECGGNITKTSGQIDVHRNTLLQRLDRLQKLCAIDLEQLSHRLPLLIAIKVYRLRACSNHHL